MTVGAQDVTVRTVVVYTVDVVIWVVVVSTELELETGWVPEVVMTTELLLVGELWVTGGTVSVVLVVLGTVWVVSLVLGGTVGVVSVTGQTVVPTMMVSVVTVVE